MANIFNKVVDVAHVVKEPVYVPPPPISLDLLMNSSESINPPKQSATNESKRDILEKEQESKKIQTLMKQINMLNEKLIQTMTTIQSKEHENEVLAKENKQLKASIEELKKQIIH